MKRINKRSRTEEASIPFDYLKDLHESHESWLSSEEHVLTIESEDNMYDQKEIINKKIDTIMKWFADLSAQTYF